MLIVKENIKKMQQKGVGHAALELNVNYLMKFPLYKNPTFKEEKEWRIIDLSSPGSPKLNGTINDFQFWETKYRSSGGKIISYLEFDFSKLKRDFVKEIWIGPKSKISELDILELLSACGYFEGVSYNNKEPISIYTSNSSYR